MFTAAAQAQLSKSSVLMIMYNLQLDIQPSKTPTLTGQVSVTNTEDGERTAVRDRRLKRAKERRDKNRHKDFLNYRL